LNLENFLGEGDIKAIETAQAMVDSSTYEDKNEEEVIDHSVSKEDELVKT
jgi:hypothetical protein